MWTFNSLCWVHIFSQGSRLFNCLSFNSLCWVPERRAFPICVKVGLPDFQFPLLGSTLTPDEIIIKVETSFNSLCWVHQVISSIPSWLIASFNSLCWVLSLIIYVIVQSARSFQFPLLGSKTRKGSSMHINHPFNSLCWVLINPRQ